jgi:hypothetical protein
MFRKARDKPAVLSLTVNSIPQIVSSLNFVVNIIPFVTVSARLNSYIIATPFYCLCMGKAKGITATKLLHAISRTKRLRKDQY